MGNALRTIVTRERLLRTDIHLLNPRDYVNEESDEERVPAQPKLNEASVKSQNARVKSKEKAKLFCLAH